MTNDRNAHECTATTANAGYDAPRLALIGEAGDVILGVLGSGDDYFGYTPPEFEFQSDDDVA